MAFALLRILIAALITLPAVAQVPAIASAQSCGGSSENGACTPAESVRLKVGNFDVNGLVSDKGKGGFDTALTGQSQQQQDHQQSTETDTSSPARAAGPVIANGYCWHDDHAFLPTGAQSGISCDGQSTSVNVDPYQIARSLFDHLNLPDLRINMNPRLGMVAVPTWFWVEGYNGATIPLSSTLRLPRQECHDVVDRAGGTADPAAAPSTHRDCTTVYDTLSVQVRAWPRTFQWSFGDTATQTVNCPMLATCAAGLGVPFTSSNAPSPIAHSYRWSSLGANGSADAYTIDLGIVFGAQYRFSLNGQGSGWQDLGDRELDWSAGHRVQEAQAVLTRP